MEGSAILVCVGVAAQEQSAISNVVRTRCSSCFTHIVRVRNAHVGVEATCSREEHWPLAKMPLPHDRLGEGKEKKKGG